MAYKSINRYKVSKFQPFWQHIDSCKYISLMKYSVFSFVILISFLTNCSVCSFLIHAMRWEWALCQIWPFYGVTWSSNGPTNGFFLILNQCAKGCSMPNFTLLGVSCSPFPKYGQNMALLWPKLGPHMVLQVVFSWIIINVPRNAPCQISQI